MCVVLWLACAGCKVVLLWCLMRAGSGPVFKSRIKSIQNQSPGPLPPCRPIEFRAPASIWQRAQVVGRAGSVPVPCRLAPTWEAMGLGSRLPLRTGALTARLRKRKPGRGPSVPCPSTPRLARCGAGAIRQSSLYTHAPNRTVHRPSHNKSGLLGLFLSFVPLSILLLPSHHITSHCASHRIAAPLRRRLRISTCAAH